MKKWLILLFGATSIALFSLSRSTLAATYTVNSTAATDDGTCTHPYVDASNDCTFEEAIDSANAAAGTDTINFNISTANFADDGDGQFNINLGSGVLPTVSTTVDIDAASLWDTTGTKSDRPGVKVQTTNSASPLLLLNTAGADGSQIQGLELTGGSDVLQINGADSIAVGTDCDGTNDGKERNVLYGERADWNSTLDITSADAVEVKGNYIGIQADGTTKYSTNLPRGATSIHITGSSNVLIGYEEGTNTTCAANLQRNSIGHSYNTSFTVGTEGYGDGINIFTTTSNLRITGNYIGVGADGVTNIGPFDGVTEDTGRGIICDTENANGLYIGTDGDGTDDSLETNVIGNWGSAGINLQSCGTNIRVSGNTIGITTAGTSAANRTGLSVRDDMVVGWCDTTVDSDICSNGGSQSTQANSIGFNTANGVTINSGASTPFIYGNAIGTNLAGTADYGNVGDGIELRQNTSMTAPYYIGGTSSNQGNIIKYNNIGVSLDGAVTGSTASALEDYRVSGNTISSNDSYGIHVRLTELYGTAGPNDGTISSNTIQSNGSHGIYVEGSSPSITSNTTTSNSGYGIYVFSNFQPDLGSYSNPYDSLSPNNASDDAVSRPNISSNTINSNSSGGIYLLDANANNASTLLADNTFSSNNSNPHIRRDWYGAVELLTAAGAQITNGDYTVSLAPTNGSCLTICSGSSVSTIWAKSGVSYNDATTWFALTDYVVSAAGTETNYNPYTITVSGDTTNDIGVSYSFNGTNDDTASTAGLANGISTNSLYRYQIAEVKTSSDPSTPTNTTPTDGATGVALAPTLTASAFSDSTETHASTMWDVFSTSALCSAVGVGDIYSISSSTDLTSSTVPSGELSAETTYYWHVTYTNSFGNRATSSCTSFTTIRTQPSFSGAISDITWDEDTTAEAFTISDYFSDAEGETLSYTTTLSEDTIDLTIQTDGVVELSSDSNWNGTATLTLTACDTDGECVDSNDINLTVTSVNDVPTTPTAGFSPSDSDTTADLTPTISWTASTDVDHDADRLSYQVRLGHDSHPTTNYGQQLTSNQGQARVTSATLDDASTYYYVVRAVDPLGGTSDWSAVQTFATNESVTPQLSLTKAVDGATSNLAWLPTQPTFVVTILTSGLAAITRIVIVEPNQIITVILSYANTGNGDATDVELIDNGTSTSLGTIASGEQGEVSYEYTIENPVSSSSLTLPAATLTSNEQTVSSNTVSLAVTTASITGTVRRANGSTLADVTITLTGDATTTTTTTTNDNGEYAFSGLGDGSYTLTVTPPSGYATPDTLTVTALAGTAYTDRDFTLYRLASGGDDSDEEEEDADEETDETDDEEEEIILTPEEQELADELETTLVVVTVDDTTVNDAGTIDLGENTSLIEQLLFSPPDTVTIGGVTLPNATVHIKICYTQLSTTSDDEGKWVMTISRDLLAEGENVIYATAEKDGVTSQPVEVARIIVPEKPPRSAVFGSFFAILCLWLLNIIALVSIKRAWWLAGSSMSVGALLLVGMLLPQYLDVYDATARAKTDHTTIALQSVNDIGVTPTELTAFSNTNQLTFTGDATDAATIALTVCDDQPFRTVTTNPDQRWSINIPASTLPKTTFTLSAQTVEGDALGEPQRLAELNISKQNLIKQVQYWFIVAFAIVTLATGLGWLLLYRRARQQNTFNQQDNNHIDTDIQTQSTETHIGTNDSQQRTTGKLGSGIDANKFGKT